MSTTYLKRYAYPEKLSDSIPPENLSLIVTIPCYNEESLIPCLESLSSCDMPEDYQIEVIVLINEPEVCDNPISKTNKKCFQEASDWIASHLNDRLTFHLHYKKLPKKHAGVGLARKIIMDEAARRFEQIANNQGVIACYDADCTCDANYLIEILAYFEKYKKCPGASIYFEHNLSAQNAEAIIDYELFLRYYVNALRYAGFPFAYETIGSSMAVRADAYQKQGGMNRKKAGEDFYFLHKIIPLGNFGEINTTRVIPSSRVSDRVPFGTGKAVSLWLENKKLEIYSLQTFVDLKTFISHVPDLYNKELDDLRIPTSIHTYFSSIDADESITKVKNNAASYDTFIKQFYQWFDGFNVLKFVHFSRDHFYPKKPLKDEVIKLAQLHYGENWEGSKKQLLHKLREKDKLGK